MLPLNMEPSSWSESIHSSNRKHILHSSSPTVIKIIHIVENLDRGAVENWLVRMLRHANSRGIQLNWTFYCALGKAGCLDDEVRNLGGNIIYSPVPICQKWAFIKALRQDLKDGSYAVLHCHHDLISGIYLIAALGLPIRKRLVHAHNADEAVLTHSPRKQYLFRPALRQICLRLADGIIGVSNHTLDTLLAGRPRRQSLDRVHYYGIDPTAFLEAKADRREFRDQVGLSADAIILLFAGRLVPEKNPGFVLNVLGELLKLEPEAVGVFVGSGIEEVALQERAVKMGMEKQTRFLGWRTDIPEIMCCCDWFILPRPEKPMEGFGIAVVEAQLAGLRLLLSEGIPDDPLLPGSCVRRLSLSEPAATWAQEAQELMAEATSGCGEAAAALAISPMAMDDALSDLLRVYEV